MAKRRENRVHVYNFGFFYLPSYQEDMERGNRQMGFEDGTLNVWEGNFESGDTTEDPNNHWPIV